MKWRSFDIFDTVLTRRWHRPVDVFLLVARRLRRQGLISPEQAGPWAAARAAAEVEARRETGKPEITLDDIYTRLGEEFGWSDSRKRQAAEIEIEAEVESVVPIARTAKMIRDLRAKGCRIAFLSDMYLASDVIKRMLATHGLLSEGDVLLVSSTTGATKSSGAMFKEFLSVTRARADEVIHIGDNRHSDYSVPRGLGMQAEIVEYNRPNRYELAMYNASGGGGEFRSRVAGVSRAARLSRAYADERLQTIWDVACNVIGPMLFGYVWWVLRQAGGMKLDRLYFVARDGQILHRIAEAICRQWGCSVRCSYLYGSRHAWHFPAMDKFAENDLDWVFAPTHFLSARSVCSRVNIEPEKVRNLLEPLGLPPQRWDDQLTKEETGRLRSCFREKPVRDAVESLLPSYREAAMGYLRQEGLLSGERYAIVDIGWNGRLQQSLSRLLDRAGARPEGGLTGFYFGLNRKLKAFDSDSLEAYMIQPDDTPAKRHLAGYVSLYELFCCADHGSTVRYERSATGEYVPVLRWKINERAIRWGLPVMQEGIMEFCCGLVNALPSELVDGAGLDRTVAALLRRFMSDPSQAEARAFGAFQISEDQTEQRFYPLCPDVNYGDILRYVLFGAPILMHGTWPEGAIRRSFLLFREAMLRLLHVKQGWRAVRRRTAGLVRSLSGRSRK